MSSKRLLQLGRAAVALSLIYILTLVMATDLMTFAGVIKEHIPLMVALCSLIIGCALCITYRCPTILAHEEDYTSCMDADASIDVPCRDRLNILKSCNCFWMLELKQDILGEVLVSYKLEGYSFDQPDIVTKYTLSRDEKQLKGDLSHNPSEACGQYRYRGDTPIAPCGAVANTMFNDTFKIYQNNTLVPIVKTGLVPDNVKSKYKNPPGNLSTAFANFSKPVDWGFNVWQLSTEEKNNGFQNEDFIVWMERTSAQDVQSLPLYGKLESSVNDGGMKAGTYYLKIYYNYVVPENARKILVLWNQTYNKALLTTGSLFLVLAGGLIILIIYKKCKKKKVQQESEEPAMGEIEAHRI